MALFSLGCVLLGFFARDVLVVRLGKKPLCGRAQQKNCSLMMGKLNSIHNYLRCCIFSITQAQWQHPAS